MTGHMLLASYGLEIYGLDGNNHPSFVNEKTNSRSEFEKLNAKYLIFCHSTNQRAAQPVQITVKTFDDC